MKAGHGVSQGQNNVEDVISTRGGGLLADQAGRLAQHSRQALELVTCAVLVARAAHFAIGAYMNQNQPS